MRWKTVLAWLACLGVAACGRVNYAPREVDSGFDTRLDVGPVPDVRLLPDAATGACRVRWTQRVSGAGSDTITDVWVDRLGRVFVEVFGQPTTLGGMPCRQCLASFDRDGRFRFVVPSNDLWGVGTDRAISYGFLGGRNIEEHDLDTGALVRVLGTVSNGGGGSSGHGATEGAGAAVFFGDLGGTLTGVLDMPYVTAGGAADLAGVVVYFRGAARAWGVVLDSDALDLLDRATILPSGDVAIYARNFNSTAPACLSSGGLPLCVGRGDALAAILSGEDGRVLSGYVIPRGSHDGLVLADNTSYALVSSRLERRDAGGAVVWSRPISITNNGRAFVHDAARRRLVALVAFDETSSYDGVPMGIPTPGGSVAVLEIDDATGALRRTFAVGSNGRDGASGLAVDAEGRLLVAVSVEGDADLCMGGAGHGGMSDGLLFALD